MNAKTIAIFTLSAFALIACEHGDIVETREFEGAIDTVEVNMDASGLEIIAIEDGPATVEADLSYFFRKPNYDARRYGTTLLVDYDCRVGCEGSITVRVPAEVDVVADNGSGSIKLEGIVGDIDLDAGSGSIKGYRLGAASTVADVGSGSVKLEYDETPEEVDVEAGSGSVKVTVPYGSYDVSVKTGSGSTDVDDLIDDPDAPNHIRVEAGSGSVSVKGIR